MRDDRSLSLGCLGVALALVAGAGCAERSLPSLGGDGGTGADFAAPPGDQRAPDLAPPPTPPIEAATCADWAQGGHDPGHSGVICATGQTLSRTSADFVFDPFVLLERAESQGAISAHYQAPLVVGDDVYMETKTGRYVSCKPPGSGTPAPCGNAALDAQTWTEKRFHWGHGVLREVWTFATDWKPAPMSPWEPVFQPIAWQGVLYIPGAGGTVYKVDRRSGAPVTRINPFGTALDSRAWVTSGLTVDGAGNVYYTAIRIKPAAGGVPEAAAGYLVRISPGDIASKVAMEGLIPNAPAAVDDCVQTYGQDTPLPWPPPPGADGKVPPPLHGPCGAQRPALNATPAIGPGGTLFVVSVAHLNNHYGYVVALHPDLTLKWATSLRGLLQDGCGVLLPSDGHPEHCRAGATKGVDPATNAPPDAVVDDTSSSSPVALPDGGVLYGALTLYNAARGHLMKLDAAGRFAGSYDFGWDTTPAVRVHDGTYSILLKDNHYNQDAQGVGLGPYFITQLSAQLAPEWKFQSTNTKSCLRDASGRIVCKEDHPHGFEWCVNSIAVDETGVVYANSEDGNVYAIRPDGKEREHLFLDLALGAAYTPLSIGRKGIVYSLNNGHLSAVGF